MTEHETIPGAVYAVEAEGHIQVINPAGVVVYEGENALSFPAVHASYDILPEGAAVRQVFKCAPRTKLHLLMGGAGGWLPQGFTELEYLEASGTQCIGVPFVWQADSGWEMTSQMLGAGRHNYAFILGTSSDKVYPGRDGDFNKLEIGFIPAQINRTYVTADNVSYSVFSHSYRLDLGRMEIASGGLRDSKDTPSGYPSNNYYTIFPAIGKSSGKDTIRPNGLVRFFDGSLYAGGEKVYNLIPVLDQTGVPCVFDTISRKPYYNSGTGDFIAGLTLRQARELRLPSGGGSLTLSLPYEASVDAAAQAALERARAAGWTLTLQYREGVLPAGYRKLEYLETSGTQYFTFPNPGMTWQNPWEVKYQDLATTHNNLILGFSTTPFAYWSENSNRWLYYDNFAANYRMAIYRTPKHSTSMWAGTNKKVHVARYTVSPQKIFRDTSSGSLNDQSDMADTVYILTEGSRRAVNTRLFYVILGEFMHLVAVLDADGTPCMYDKISGTCFYNSGSGAFIAGLATIDDVRTLYLAPTGGSITLSIPAETPQGYIAALQRNNPNWTISIQYRES